MIVHDVVQGTESWKKLRAGRPTASNFAKILTPTGKKSEQMEAYMFEMLAERMMGRPSEGFSSTWMDRGKEKEDAAIASYEFTNDVRVKRVGFVTDDLVRYGASPDGEVGKDGLIEIKCPADHTHAMYLFKKSIEAKYYPQLQGQLWVCEREWVDILSYHPEMPEALIRVERDEKFIKQLEGLVLNLCYELEDRTAQLVERGVIKPFVVPQPVPEDFFGNVSTEDLVDDLMGPRP